MFWIGGEKGEGVIFTVLRNLLAGRTRMHAFRRFMPSPAGGSDLSEKAVKSLKQKAKKKNSKMRNANSPF